MVNSNITDYAKARIRRVTDARELTPVQLLRDLADQIDEGILDPAGCTVVMLNRKPDGSQELRVSRAQISILEEAGLLTLAQIDSARVLAR